VHDVQGGGFTASRCRILTTGAPDTAWLASPQIKRMKQGGAFAPPIPLYSPRDPVRATSTRAAPLGYTITATARRVATVLTSPRDGGAVTRR
jgi:hypothetical protein